EGYAGPVTMIGAESNTPVDRPNLSKDYLAGTAPPEWVPLRDESFYKKHAIELVLGTRVESFDPAARQVKLANGTSRSHGALLLATGAEPVRLDVPGSDAEFVHTLRSFADSKAIIARATSKNDARAVVVGASFIGLEVAASLRTRGLEVHVVAPGGRPLERVMGDEVGDFIRSLHEEHGVLFHLGNTPERIDGAGVALSSGTVLPADLIVAGIGVRPSIGLAERAGITVDGGIVVDEFLETSRPGIFAAGDVARWPDPRTGQRARVEHWVVAERQGQVAARNMLGRREKFEAVPFFWSQHYDVAINYVGHAEEWEAIEIDGSLDAGDCAVTYKKGGRTLAVATISRDLQSLQAEAAMEAEIRMQRREVA